MLPGRSIASQFFLAGRDSCFCFACRRRKFIMAAWKIAGKKDAKAAGTRRKATLQVRSARSSPGIWFARQPGGRLDLAQASGRRAIAHGQSTDGAAAMPSLR